MRKLALLTFVLGCATGAATSHYVGSANAQVPAGMPLWEYRCVAGMKWSDMNSYGAQGWELVTSTGGNGADVCFKRSAGRA